MESKVLKEEFLGSKVFSKVYGHGLVCAIKDTDSDYYITISFKSNGTSFEKTFKAGVALRNNSIVFDSEALNKKMTLMMSDIRLKEETNEPKIEIKNSNNEISQNDCTNNLIHSLSSHNSIAMLLISLFDDEDYEEDVCSEAFMYLEEQMNGNKISQWKKYCIIVALTLIALKYYDRDLHSHIEEKYRQYRPKTESRYSKVKIQKALYSVLEYERKKIKYFDLNSYVAVPIVLCCVPAYRIKDLFRIAYDIYKKKLLFDEDIEDEQIKEKVKETFLALRRKDLINDSDVIKGTQYLMSKYTQSCIYSGVGIDELINITANCIRLIILFLTRPEESYKVEAYYLEGFNTWTKQFLSDEKEFERFQKNRSVSRPFFKLLHNEIHLFTGEFCMDDSYNPNDIKICVYSAEKLIKCFRIDDPNTIEYTDKSDVLGGFIINRCEIIINEFPLDNLNYSIIASEEEIYNSKDRLFRNVIFFDGKGNEIKPGYDYNGEIFVVAHGFNKHEYEERIRPYFQGKGFVIFSIEVNSHEVFHFDGHPFIFYKIAEPKLIGYIVPWAKFQSIEGKLYSIFSDLTILFQAPCAKEDVVIDINGIRYSYGEDTFVNYNIRLFSNNYDGNWAYTIRIFNLEAGFHQIKIINAKIGKLIKGANIKVVYDPKLCKRYMSKDYEGIKYELITSFSENQDISYKYGMSLITLPSFVKYLGHGRLNIYPTSISYSIDGNTWLDLDNKLYLCEIDEEISSIKFCGPGNMRAYYYDGKKPSIDNKVEAIFRNEAYSDNIYVFFLNYLRTQQDKKLVRLCLEFGTKMKYVEIWYDPFVRKDDCKFYFSKEKNSHCFDVRFDGKSKLKCCIKALESGQILREDIIISGQIIEIKDSEIPDNVRDLSISLFGKRYGSLFSAYKNEPIITFPKYSLSRISTVITNWFPKIEIRKNTIFASFNFEGSDCALIKIYPTGYQFSSEVFKKKIISGEELIVDISCFPFDSFTLCLYPSKTKIDSNNFDDKSIFTSKPVKRVETYILRTKKKVQYFLLDNGKKVRLNFESIYFAKIEEINNQYYVICKLIDTENAITKDDIIVHIKNVVNRLMFLEIRQKLNNEMVRLKLKNGALVKEITIDME